MAATTSTSGPALVLSVEKIDSVKKVLAAAFQEMKALHEAASVPGAEIELRHEADMKVKEFIKLFNGLSVATKKEKATSSSHATALQVFVATLDGYRETMEGSFPYLEHQWEGETEATRSELSFDPEEGQTKGMPVASTIPAPDGRAKATATRVKGLLSSVFGSNKRGEPSASDKTSKITTAAPVQAGVPSGGEGDASNAALDVPGGSGGQESMTAATPGVRPQTNLEEQMNAAASSRGSRKSSRSKATTRSQRSTQAANERDEDVARELQRKEVNEAELDLEEAELKRKMDELQKRRQLDGKLSEAKLKRIEETHEEQQKIIDEEEEEEQEERRVGLPVEEKMDEKERTGAWVGQSEGQRLPKTSTEKVVVKTRARTRRSGSVGNEVTHFLSNLTTPVNTAVGGVMAASEPAKTEVKASVEPTDVQLMSVVGLLDELRQLKEQLKLHQS